MKRQLVLLLNIKTNTGMWITGQVRFFRSFNTKYNNYMFYIWNSDVRNKQGKYTS